MSLSDGEAEKALMVWSVDEEKGASLCNGPTAICLLKSSQAKSISICFPLPCDYPFSSPLFSLIISFSLSTSSSIIFLPFLVFRLGSDSSDSMELVHELFLSASLALLLSFLVAKLVSMAMASDVNREVEMNLGLFADKLAVQAFGSEKQVESVVRSAETIDKFLGEQPDVGPTVENVCFRGEFQEKLRESLEILSCDHLGEKSECDVLPKNILEGPILSEMVVENSSNSNAEGCKEPNVDDINDRMRLNAMAEDIGEEEQNDVLQSPTVEADKEEDDDGWEGIERTELENVFAAASRFVSEEDGLEDAGNELEMEFYGLHKVATEGPCRESRPMALKVSARAKWNAWQKLGNMSPEVAMEQYITLLSDRTPGWMEHSSTGCSKPESSETGEAEYLLHHPNGRKLAELDSGGNRGAIAANYH